MFYYHLLHLTGVAALQGDEINAGRQLFGPAIVAYPETIARRQNEIHVLRPVDAVSSQFALTALDVGTNYHFFTFLFRGIDNLGYDAFASARPPPAPAILPIWP